MTTRTITVSDKNVVACFFSQNPRKMMKFITINDKAG